MLRRPAAPALLLLLVIALLAAGCGSSSSDGSDKAPPPAKAADFPKANGQTLAQLQHKAGSQGLVLAPTQSQYKPGRNRFAFALFDSARKQISNLPVVLYVARAGGGKAGAPVPAKWQSLAVKPQFQSRSVASDPNAAKSLYSAEIDLPRTGRYEVLGIARLNKRLVPAADAAGALKVSAGGPVPAVGQRPPAIDTPTRAGAGGDIRKIDTRLPPATDLHDTSFKDVLGKKPVILLFATPALCQSRVCGPVVDIAEQVKAEDSKGATFIQQEIYKDNDLKKGFRPQVRAFNLPTEPWLFAVNRHGKIVDRIEGAFSVSDMERAVDKATKG